MGEHVGNDGTHDVGLAVDDHDILPPHEVREVRIRDLADKVVRQRKQRDIVGDRAADADMTLLVGTDATGAPC
jgi:hypothetical protein